MTSLLAGDAMSIDYSAFAFPKARVRALVKDEQQAKERTTDEKENAKARARANGRCEVQTLLSSVGRKKHYQRCERRDVHTHHLLGGIGRRNKGASILADNKLRVCDSCHSLITAHVLQPINGKHDAHTVRYWRSK
jgi:hypothetical protein